ncbi:MAG: TetR/AcrR family transcriptional regulator [Lautropia sp.]
MATKPPRRTRERILALSLRLFNEIGEPNVTTSAIADEMGISPGNLYYHFRNKDDIVNALFEDFEREIDRLFEAASSQRATVEDAWFLLHLMFETIWKHRFFYRDLNDLLSRNRRLENYFQRLLTRKTAAARQLCVALANRGELAATAFEIETLATNMAVVTTYWLSFEYVSHARRFSEAGYQGAAIARGAFQVLSLTGAYLTGPSRQLLQKLAAQYLEPAATAATAG